MIKDENGKPLKGSCGDEIAYKLAKRDIVLYFRENPTLSNKELLVWAQSKGHDSSDIADIIRHLNYARVFKKSELVKSNMEKFMEKAKKMPVGTISHGRKKVAEGKWVPWFEGKKKKVVKKETQGTLPLDVSTLTEVNAISLIKQAVKIPLKTLRRNQDIVEQQKERAYKQQKHKVLDRLEVMGDIYTAAVDIKEFKDTTPKEWGEEIIERISKMKKSLMKGKAGTRGVPDGSGPEGKGPTGRRMPPQKPKREDFDSDETFSQALVRWKNTQGKNIKKSRMEGFMERGKSGLALVIFPGELTKAANLSGIGSSIKHPAKLSGVKGNTKSKIPYTSHTERMALAKMAAERMMAPKPENEGKYVDTPEVDRKGREKGQKPAGAVGSTGVSGMESQAHDNFGRETVIVNPTDLGAGRPESAAKYGGVKKVAKPRS